MTRFGGSHGSVARRRKSRSRLPKKTLLRQVRNTDRTLQGMTSEPMN